MKAPVVNVMTRANDAPTLRQDSPDRMPNQLTFSAGAEGIFQIGEPGYIAWGALDANPYAPFQIELENTESVGFIQALGFEKLKSDRIGKKPMERWRKILLFQ